jgi:hypothetical protein
VSSTTLFNVLNDLERKINQTLDILMSLTAENEMKVRQAKTKYQIFSISNFPDKPSLKLGNDELEETESQTYLDVTLDRRLTMKFHASQQANKAENRLKLLKRLAGSNLGNKS